MKSQLFFILFSIFLLFSLHAKAQDSLHDIVIHDMPDGEGSEINDIIINAGDSVILYAAGYDTAGNYISDQIAKWTTTGSLDKMENNGTQLHN